MNAGHFTFLEATIESIHKSMLAKSLTCMELVSWYLARIEAFDRQGPAIQAIVNINGRALAEAESLDSHLQTTGKLKGSLHGIPVLVKDQGETADIPTTFGNKAFAAYLPDSDATIVKRFRDAGAIILAKTSMPDFGAGWFSFSSMTGHTKNPYAPERDAGGSSAGTGAGIAANFGTVGIGEDTGGSIRVPASFNNLFGLRATTGLVSRKGFSPLVHFQDCPGPMARTVRDVAKVLDVIAGFDPEDPFTYVADQTPDAGRYESLLDGASLKGVRFGILQQAFGPDDAESGPVNQAVKAAMDRMNQLGAEFIEFDIPGLQEFIAESSVFRLQSKHDLSRFLGSRANAPLKSFMEMYETGAFHPFNDLIHANASGPEDPAQAADYYRKRLAQEEFRRAILYAFALHGIDAMIFPDVRILPPTYRDLESGKVSRLLFPTNTVIASQTGLPALSVPAGFTADGIPVGFEWVGKPLSEAALLQYAYAYEQYVRPRKPPLLLAENGEAMKG